MEKGEACKRLTAALQHCTAAQFSAVREILKLGARLSTIPARRLSWPANVPQERREILVTLMDALYEHDRGGDGSARQQGVWEYAMATLLIERDWQAIRRAAAALKSEARLLRNARHVTTRPRMRVRHSSGTPNHGRRHNSARFRSCGHTNDVRRQHKAELGSEHVGLPYQSTLRRRSRSPRVG
jgi:hypothetical protein